MTGIKKNSHLHYLHYLDSIDILGECGDDGEVDGVCLNSWPNVLLLVSKTSCSGTGGFNLVTNRTAYILLWYFFLGGVIFYPLQG